MNATLNGQELPNTPVKGVGYEFTTNGWVTNDGTVITCSVCGLPITREALDEQALSLDILDSFDEISHTEH
jgi:hypothetical protein